MDFILRPLDVENQSSTDWNKIYEFRRIMHDHVSPDDPMEPNDIWKRNISLQLKDPNTEFEFFRVLKKDKIEDIIGLFGIMHFAQGSPNYEKNPHLAMMNLQILPKYRRFGIGSRLLKNAYERLNQLGKKVVVGGGTEEDAREFAKRVGAIEALTGVDNRLDLTKVDWELMDEWIISGQQRSPNNQLVIFETIPELLLKEYAEVVTETLNQAPIGEIDFEQIITPEEIRKEEEKLGKMEKVQITAITQEPDGHISGVTWITYNPHRSTIIDQGLTGVREQYRGRGLGKRLKAEIAIKVKETYPQSIYIKTENATTNEPMLSINERMGFKVHKKTYNFQISMDDLGKYVETLDNDDNIEILV